MTNGSASIGQEDRRSRIYDRHLGVKRCLTAPPLRFVPSCPNLQTGGSYPSVRRRRRHLYMAADGICRRPQRDTDRQGRAWLRGGEVQVSFHILPTDSLLRRFSLMFAGRRRWSINDEASMNLATTHRYASPSFTSSGV